MYAYTPCPVLLIDDDPSVSEFVQALLTASKPAVDAQSDLFQLRQVERLGLGLEILKQDPDKIVLLDLNLPDSHGIETLARMRRTYPLTPTIVLTGMDDDVVAVKAIEAGAQGFLNKDNLDANLLAYALLLARDRQRQLQTALPTQTAKGSAAASKTSLKTSLRQREIEHFERLASSVRPAAVTSNLFDSGLLKDTVPDVFEALLETYLQILDQVLEQKMFRVDHAISSQLRSLAEQLGFLKAGARDVVELHTLALKQKRETENAIKTKVYAAEGRMVVLELMGYLATYYRKFFIGLSKINTLQTEQKVAQQQAAQQAAQRMEQPKL